VIYKNFRFDDEFLHIAMSDPFLSLPGTKRKRPSKPDRRNGTASNKAEKSSKPAKRRLRDPRPESEDEDEIGAGGIESEADMVELEESEESDNEETPAERRLRLAKEYLDTVRNEVGVS
jgi:ribosomal RNA-processing protein 9